LKINKNFEKKHNFLIFENILVLRNFLDLFKMLLSFYFNELHQRIKNILFFKKTTNYRLFVNERGTKALLRWFSSIAFLFLQGSFYDSQLIIDFV